MRSATVAGELVRAAREERGLTQAKLAKKCKVHHATIANIELGYRQPSGQTFLAIVKALGVPRESLLVQEAA